ncbi:MAG TPA: hypothetical protein PK629_06640 [Oscillospiraceae bacterium]|nr:hypothetical protein [Oscillospiraceae bacterium]HPF55312.1 hypothetical protein [Clostridiales bacterium]HPK36104.1 hypothetical protein [Oscillospiraceae bacterium]HPR76619.1 hypothetical protein [Oscillospiraceae bacterium]
MSNKTTVKYLKKYGPCYQAQKKFKANAKKYPGPVSYHNLGVYYYMYGTETPEGKVRSANALSLKYLRRAHEQNSALFENLMYLGRIANMKHQYNEAVVWFQKALEVSDVFISHYLLASSYYKIEEFEKAAAHFQNSWNLCENEDDRFAVKLAYAFSVWQTDHNKGRDVLFEIINNGCLDLEPDVLALSFLCSEYELTYQLSETTFQKWHIDLFTLAMIMECYFKLEKEIEAKEFFNGFIENLKGYEYNIKPEMRGAQKIFKDGEYRRKIINEFKFIPLWIDTEYFTY